MRKIWNDNLHIHNAMLRSVLGYYQFNSCSWHNLSSIWLKLSWKILLLFLYNKCIFICIILSDNFLLINRSIFG